MTDVDNRGCGPLGRFVRAFYDARRAASRTGDLSLLEPFIAADVRWSEPDVGAHMGLLEGRDAVLDMLRRALETTGGTFDLRVTSTLETPSHVAASIAWSATKGGLRIEGEELAVHGRANSQLRCFPRPRWHGAPVAVPVASRNCFRACPP